jgi:thiamine pyrophosphokinase
MPRIVVTDQQGVAIKQDKDEYSTDLMKCISEIEETEAAAETTEQVYFILGSC